MRVAKLAALLLLMTVSLAPVSGQGRWQHHLYGGEAFCAATHGERLWIGTSAGIRLFEQIGGALRATELTTRDNLPGNSITALAFEPDAAWVGTSTGVVGRLNLETNQWQVYDERARFPQAPVSDLLYDGQDVWAATRGGGLARFNALRHDWEVWNSEDGAADDVRALAADPDGLWAATDRGLLRYVKPLMRWEPVTPPPGRLEGGLTDVATSAGYLWVASPHDGLCRIGLKGGEFLTYDLSKFEVRRVDRLLTTLSGDVWIACDNGLLRAEREGDGAWHLSSRGPWEVRGLAELGDSLWLGTAASGVWRYRPATDEWEQYRSGDVLPSGVISAAGAQANLGWFGFPEAGLAAFDMVSGRWEGFLPPGGSPRRVRDLAVVGDRVYCACADGIAVYDQKGRFWRTFTVEFEPALLSDEWTSVVVSGDTAWFAGPGRVAVFTAEMSFLRTFELRGADSDRAGTLPKLYADDSSGDIWCVTPTLAYRYQPRHQLWSWLEGDYFLPRDPALYRREGRLIRALVCDNDNAWFVTLDRVVQYRKQLNDVVLWDAGIEPGLAAPRLPALDRFAAWVAGGAGLCRFERQPQRWEAFPWPDELVGEEPTALAVDPEEPYVWVATARHTARLELADGGGRWTVYPAATGIVSGVHEILPVRDGVWFVGQGGVSLYRRERAAAPR